MQKVRSLAALVSLLGLAACQTVKVQPAPAAPVPPPVVAPQPPTEPFVALLEATKDPRALDIAGTDHVTRQQFKDHFLQAFTAADRLDGSLDGSAPIAESCKELLELCRAADVNGDGKLSLKEFLDKVDELFDRADRNRDQVLSRREITRLRP